MPERSGVNSSTMMPGLNSIFTCWAGSNCAEIPCAASKMIRNGNTYFSCWYFKNEYKKFYTIRSNNPIKSGLVICVCANSADECEVVIPTTRMPADKPAAIPCSESSITQQSSGSTPPFPPPANKSPDPAFPCAPRPLQ